MLFPKIKKEFHAVRNSKFARNVATLATGNIISQVITLFTAPISSRVFSPDLYGQLGLYMSISGILGALVFSHYPQAILQEREEDTARNLVWFNFALSLFLCALIFFSIVVIKNFSTILDNMGFWAFLIPMSVFLSAANQILLLWANRQQEFKHISSNRVIQTIITVTIQLGVGIGISKQFGLMAGFLAGQLLGPILLGLYLIKSEKSKFGVPQFDFFIGYFKKYRNYLYFTTPSDFINNLINQLPIFFLNQFGGLFYIGSFSFAQRILGMPITLLGSSIADVFRQRATVDYAENGNCERIFKKTFIYLFSIGLFPCLVLILFAPFLFTTFFGASWHTAGRITQFLSIFFLFKMVASPLSYMFLIANKLREDFILHLLSILLISAAFLISNFIFEDKIYLILSYSLAYSLIYIYYLFRSHKFAKGIE